MKSQCLTILYIICRYIDIVSSSIKSILYRKKLIDPLIHVLTCSFGMHKCVGQFNKRVADFRQEVFGCKTHEAGGYLGVHLCEDEYHLPIYSRHPSLSWMWRHRKG